MSSTDPQDKETSSIELTDDVAQRLQGVFRQVFDDPDLVITATTGPDDITGWDSLGTVSLLYSIEDEFDVEIADDEIKMLSTVGAIHRRLSTPPQQG